MAGNTRRAALAAVFVLIAAVTVSALPGIHSAWAYWAASSVAVTGALVLILAGEHAWDRLLANARDASVVARH